MHAAEVREDEGAGFQVLRRKEAALAVGRVGGEADGLDLDARAGYGRLRGGDDGDSTTAAAAVGRRRRLGRRPGADGGHVRRRQVFTVQRSSEIGQSVGPVFRL